MKKKTTAKKQSRLLLTKESVRQLGDVRGGAPPRPCASCGGSCTSDDKRDEHQ